VFAKVAPYVCVLMICIIYTYIRGKATFFCSREKCGLNIF
jgi:hypothetical protein